MKFALVTCMLLLAGCADKVYVDRPVEVKVPVRCEVESPKRPAIEISPYGAKALAVYTEQLECALKMCKGETCQ